MSKKHQKNPQPKDSRKIKKESFRKRRRHYSFGFLAGNY
jgi:hypothetical protein